MSAAAVKIAPREYQAWCDECQDGINSIRRICQAWADKHNAERHKETR